MTTKKRKVRIEVDIEVDEDFNIQDLAVGKFHEDTKSDAQFILPEYDNKKTGEYFKVIDYHKIKDITPNVKNMRIVLNNRYWNVSVNSKKNIYEQIEEAQEKLMEIIQNNNEKVSNIFWEELIFEEE